MPVNDTTTAVPYQGWQSLSALFVDWRRTCETDEPRERPPQIVYQEQVVRLLVNDRTGGRLAALAVERTTGELVIRATAPCYYVKQLALHAALDALRDLCAVDVKLVLEITVIPSPEGPARPGG